MTPLMVLAATLPPSLAFVIERWMAGREAQARRLSEADGKRLDKLDSDLTSTCEALTNLNAAHGVVQAELKRLNEQLTILADRR